MHPHTWILFKKQLFDFEVKVPRRSLWYETHHLMVMHPHTKYHWPISKDKNVMARTRKYYLKNNYLTLRSKVKISWKSLRYVAHRLNGLWSCTHILEYYSKNKYLTLRSKVKVPQSITVRDTPPYGHVPTYQISLTYLERQKSYGPDKLRWEEAEAEEAEAEEKIRLKQYVSLRSKGRHNYTITSFIFWTDQFRFVWFCLFTSVLFLYQYTPFSYCRCIKQNLQFCSVNIRKLFVIVEVPVQYLGNMLLPVMSFYQMEHDSEMLLLQDLRVKETYKI